MLPFCTTVSESLDAEVAVGFATDTAELGVARESDARIASVVATAFLLKCITYYSSLYLSCTVCAFYL